MNTLTHKLESLRKMAAQMDPTNTPVEKVAVKVTIDLTATNSNVLLELFERTNTGSMRILFTGYGKDEAADMICEQWRTMAGSAREFRRLMLQAGV